MPLPPARRLPHTCASQCATASVLRSGRLTCVAFVTLAGLAGCGDSSGTRVDEPRRFTLTFDARAAGRPVNCTEELVDLGSKRARGRLLDLAFYVRDVTFVRADGSESRAELDTNAWQARGVALVDFQDRSDDCKGASKPTNAAVSGQVATQEEFPAVRFTLGLPPDLNHVNPANAKAPFNVARLFWSWQSGYKALRLDVSPVGGISRPSDPGFAGTNFFFHLGSTGCTGNPETGQAVACSRVNQPVVTVRNFAFDRRKITLDVSKLLAKLDVRVDLAETPGCMSDLADPECAAFFSGLGLDFVSGKAVRSNQTVFTYE